MVKIFIDPGHGGNDPGAHANGLKEKDLTLKISLMIRDILNNEYMGHKVKLSRTTDKSVSLPKRTSMANSWNADYLVSVHINAGGGTGYEDYIYNGRTSSSTANYRNTMHSEIVKSIDVTNRGRKKANFHMLRESKMPAILTENLFIDRKSDSEKLKSNKFLKKIARGHVNGLVKIFKLKKKSKPKPPKGLYKVQIGAFKRKDNADQLALRAKAKGFDQIVVKEKELYKVQLGAFSKKSNAKALASKARKDGFDVYIEGLSRKEGKPKPKKPIFKVGKKVKIKTSAKKYSRSTHSIPERYKNKSYTIQQVDKNDVLLKELYSWVKKSDLK